MKYLLFSLTFLLLAAFAPAQKPMEGPSKLEVNIDETPTNNTVIPVDLTTEEKSASKPASFSVDSDEEKSADTSSQSTFTLMEKDLTALSPEATPAEGVGSNDELDAKTSFLMDMGVQYTDEGDFAGAEQAYLRALKNGTNNPSIRFALSSLYLQMGRPDESAAILNVMKEEYPYHPVIYNNLAWIYASSPALKNSAKALLFAREAILSKPGDPVIWDTLAEAYYISGEYEKALRSSNHAIDLLQTQGASEEQLQPYLVRRIKIQRADEAFKRLTGVAGKEE